MIIGPRRHALNALNLLCVQAETDNVKVGLHVADLDVAGEREHADVESKAKKRFGGSFRCDAARYGFPKQLKVRSLAARAVYKPGSSEAGSSTIHRNRVLKLIPALGIPLS